MRRAALFVGLALAASAAGEPPIAGTLDIVPAAVELGGAGLFEQVDANHDGAIDRAEFSVLEKNDPHGLLGGLFNTVKKVGFVPAFVNGITMIIATELGDKTFWLAALMAMRYNRAFVFLGSIGALVVMTILSVGIGLTLPALLPKQYTHYAAAALFAYFGFKLLREASTMDPNEANEELAEAEEALTDKGLLKSDRPERKDEKDDRAGGNPAQRDSVSSTASAPRESDVIKRSTSNGKAAAANGKAGGAGVFSALSDGAWAKDWPILTQAFTITFLAEWGDRSQIATIAMAAAQDPVGVCVGGILGHSLCTGLAVIGGRLLSSKISERAVAYVGGALFLLFSVHSIIVGPDVDE